MMLIALEGIDGSGTTTQAEKIAAELEASGYGVHRTAEPSTGPIGQVIRRVLRRELAVEDRTLALLFAADRLDHLQREIEPALAAGKIVISDRYLVSSLAYQTLNAPIEWVLQINSAARLPEISILLRVSAQIGAQRRAQRGGPEEHFDALLTQRAIAEAYDRAFARVDIGPTAVIDAHRDVAAVHQSLMSIIHPLLTEKPREQAS
jgi:dTMP kinase